MIDPTNRTIADHADEARVQEAVAKFDAPAKPSPADELAAAERLAPIDVDSPLPAEARTLAYIPPEHRSKYQRRMDGEGFRLAWLNESDNRHRLAHLDHIAAGRIAVLPDGTDAQMLADREAELVAQRAEIDGYIRAAEHADKQKRLAEVERKIAAVRAKADVEAERIRRSYR